MTLSASSTASPPTAPPSTNPAQPASGRSRVAAIVRRRGGQTRRAPGRGRVGGFGERGEAVGIDLQMFWRFSWGSFGGGNSSVRGKLRFWDVPLNGHLSLLGERRNSTPMRSFSVESACRGECDSPSIEDEQC